MRQQCREKEILGISFSRKHQILALLTRRMIFGKPFNLCVCFLEFKVRGLD